MLSEQHLKTDSSQSTLAHKKLSEISGTFSTARRKTSLIRKIGMWNFSVIIVGNLLICGILGSLWYLWSGNEKQPFWRWLVLNRYIQRTITLSAVALRTIIAFQSALCTSMIAGSIMELYGFNLARSAALSIMRFNGTQPYMLLRKGNFKSNSWFLLAMTIFVSVTTIASQFTSTGLVADLEIAAMFGDPISVDTAYGYNFYTKGHLLDLYEPDFTDFMPSVYPTFGEYSETPKKTAGLDDTGNSLRGLLPISSATIRQLMSNYTGSGTVLNSHVVCMKPLYENLMLVSGGGPTGNDPLYLTGSVSVGTSIPPGLSFFSFGDGYGIPDPLASLNFSCSLAVPDLQTGEWPLSMCIAGNAYGNPNATNGGSDGGGRVEVLGLRASSLLYEGLVFDPLSYILLNYTGQLPPSSGLNINTNWTDISSNNSSWLTLQLPKTYFASLEFVSLTYCFTNFGAIDTNITVHSSDNRTEPVLQNTSRGLALDATQVLQQLGADGTNSTPSERGILTLERQDLWAYIYPAPNNDSSFTAAIESKSGFGMVFDAIPSFLVLTTWALCTGCAVSKNNENTNTTAIGNALSSVFQSSLKSSGSAAKAMQAMFTVLNMAQYYNRLQQFDLMAPSQTTLIISALQPTHHTGLATVTAFLVFHIALVLTITIIFLSRTSLSFIGEAWHTVAQLQSTHVASLLKSASLMDDGEVMRWAEGSGGEGDANKVMILGDDGLGGLEGAHVRKRWSGLDFRSW
ncbi:hypothetical protein N431DRAFT_365821 [Stipitochalara longipes BDJ]|nr:hypothetical protein N431DRAFT_365821 [Stipitochalara longipes BDJ]